MKNKDINIQNDVIDDTLFEEFLDSDVDTVKALLWYQPITVDRFMMIAQSVADPYLIAELGKNEQIDPEITMALLESDNHVLLENIAGNKSIPPYILKALFEKTIRSTYPQLAGNPNLSVPLIEEIYAGNKDDIEIMTRVASNPATPEYILGQLFERNESQINQGLITNTSTPVEIHDQLK